MIGHRATEEKQCHLLASYRIGYYKLILSLQHAEFQQGNCIQALLSEAAEFLIVSLRRVAKFYLYLCYLNKQAAQH